MAAGATLPFTVQRLTESPSGESRFDSFEIACPLKQFAPPEADFFASATQAATGYVIIQIPAGWVGQFHPSPHAQIMFCLSGAFKVTASNGDVRVIEAGEAFLGVDTQGKGHRSEVISDEPLVAVLVQVPERA